MTTRDAWQASAGNGSEDGGPALSARQERALTALLTARSVDEAAKLARVGVRTLYRWLSESPEFSSAYRQAVQAMRTALVATAQDASLHALAALRTIMEDREARATDRVAAATRILETTVQLVGRTQDRFGEAERVAPILYYPVPAPPGADLVDLRGKP